MQDIPKKHSHLYSIITCKCPRCKETNLFVNQNMYYLPDLFKMPERCSVCNLKYEMEIGFWWGAMYVAYAVSCALVLSIFLPLYLILKLSVDMSLLIDMSLTTLLFPITFRLSRSLWIHMFAHQSKV
ncbi:MAG: DUF983 domain-containing protein [Bacteroidota bacterium]